MVDSPLYDLDYNEKLIAQFRLPVEIVYLSSADRDLALDLAIATHRPLLLYHWEPSAFIRQRGPFVRLLKLPYEYCEGETDTTASQGEACDFPFQKVEKASALPLIKHPDVTYFLANFRLSYDQMMSVLMSASANGGDTWLSACEFLQANPNLLEEGAWVKARSPQPYPVLLGALLCIAMILWMFLLDPLFAACRACRARWKKKRQQQQQQPDGDGTSPGEKRGPYAEDDDGGGVEDPGGPCSQMVDDLGADDLAQALPDEKAVYGPQLLNDPYAAGKAVHVTLASRIVMTTEAEGAICIPVIQLTGDKELPVDLEIAIGDGVSTAQYGRDFGALEALDLSTQARVVNHSDGTERADGRRLRVTIPTGERHAAVVLPIYRSPGYDATKFFSLVLTPLQPGVNCHIRECVVRILNVEPFPNGKTFTPELSKRGEKTSIVYHFLLEVHRGNLWVSAKHQVAQMAYAVFNGFLMPELKKVMINSFTAAGARYDMSVYAGLTMMGLYFLSMQLTFWFHAGWDVQRKLQRNLTRKFLTMTEHDLPKISGDQGEGEATSEPSPLTAHRSPLTAHRSPLAARVRWSHFASWVQTSEPAQSREVSRLLLTCLPIIECAPCISTGGLEPVYGVVGLGKVVMFA